MRILFSSLLAIQPLRQSRRFALVLLFTVFFMGMAFPNEYESDPAINTYTNTGTGTTLGPEFDYNYGYIIGGNVSYTNGDLKAALTRYTSSGGHLILYFSLKKGNNGYFKNGNSGKIFVVDQRTGDGMTPFPFSITNSTTGEIPIKVEMDDFSDGYAHPFAFYLITSDKVYKQYGGTINVTCTHQDSPPHIATLDATYINQSSATLNGTVRPNGKTTTYTFSYGTSRNNMTAVTTGTVSASKTYQNVEYTLTGLTSGRTYYFQLTGYNSVGSSEGDILSFQTDTEPNNPPAKPTNPSPANGATNVATSGTFSWNCSDADGDFLHYDIYFGTSSSNLSYYKTSANTLCGYDNLASGTKYYWRVDPYDSEDTTTGNVWSFTTAGSTPSDDDMTAAQAAQYLQDRGIIVSGDPNTSGDIMRQDLAKIAFRGLYYAANNGTIPSSVISDNFPTVYEDLATQNSNNSYYFQAARALLYLEYGDGVTPFDRNRLKFDPTGTIQRIHVLKVLLESFDIQPKLTGTDYFMNESDIQDLASRDPRKYGYIRSAGDLGIINTSISQWRPYEYCTRGEAFLMLVRIMEGVKSGKITNPHPDDNKYFQPLNTTLKTMAMGTGLQMGNFQHYTKTSFALDGVTPLVFAHTYNSYNTTLPEVFFGGKADREAYMPLADGWSHSYHTFITEVDDNYIVHWGGGSIDVYNSALQPVSMGVYDKLTSSGGTFVVKTKSQVSYYFEKEKSGVYYLTKIVDRNNNTVSISYETRVNSMPRISSVSDGHGRTLSFSYNQDGTNLITSIRDNSIGRSIEFSYEYNDVTGRYRLSMFKDAMQNDTHYFYGDKSKFSTSKLLTKIRLPKGNYIYNNYDDNNYRLTRTENGDTKTTIGVNTTYGSYGASTTTSSDVSVTRSSGTSTYHYEFNSNNVMTSITSPQNSNFSVSVTPSPDKQHLPESIRTHSTNISNITYDENGNVKSVSVTADGKTLTTEYGYNNDNDLIWVKDPKGNKATYSYTNGNLTKVQTPISGVVTNIVRYDNGLPRTITNGAGVTVEYGYDSYGNPNSITMPLSITSVPYYDAAGRLKSMQDALGHTYSYSYDDNDNLKSSKDPKNKTTWYSYDSNDNLIGITNANNGETTLTYDDDTDWLTDVSFGGAKKSYSYNADGTLASYTKPDRTRLNYDYDALGHVTDDGINTYSYDSQTLRLKSITNKDSGKKLSLSYDGFGRVTGTTYNGHSNSYEYDDNGNCIKINNTTYEYDKLNRLKYVNFNGKTITYNYRNDSQLSSIDYNGTMTTTYGYDDAGRMLNKRTKLSNGTVIASYTYDLDKAGNITEQTKTEPLDDIALSNEEVEYSYNNANRITSAGDTSFSFDDNGNTIKRGSEQYQWDDADRLIRAGGTAITYDPLGIITSYGNITFTVDPLGIGNVLSDSKGAEYIYGNGLEARIKNGKVSYYVTDFRGSVVAIVDENGTVTHKYQYDEFGKVTQKELFDVNDYNPFQYVGKYGVMYLSEHQYYMRARHYDPTIGRFLSEDPIWSTNLYPYADNNPIMGIDPMGKTYESVNMNNIFDKSGLSDFKFEIGRLKQQVINEICKKNPNLNICKPKDSGGGGNKKVQKTEESKIDWDEWLEDELKRRGINAFNAAKKKVAIKIANFGHSLEDAVGNTMNFVAESMVEAAPVIKEGMIIVVEGTVFVVTTYGIYAIAFL